MLRPWLEAAASMAPFADRPVAVLVPSRSYGVFLKSRWMAEGGSFAGLHFWTPGDVLSFLLSKETAVERPAADEDLELLLALAAEPSEVPTAQSVAREPVGLLRALEALTSAGWTPSDLGLGGMQPVFERFAHLLSRMGLTTRAGAVQRLGMMEQPRPVIGKLLVVGFDAAHWSVWPILQAAIRHAAEASACLFFAPRFQSESIEQAWVGTWEQQWGAAQPLEDSAPGPYAVLADALERGEPADAGAWATVAMRCGRNVREEARAIVAQALAFLADPACARLGILFSGTGALAREVAAHLERFHVLHYDGLGHPLPAQPWESAWRDWLMLQVQPDRPHLLQWLRRHPEAGAKFALDADNVEASLGRARDEVVTEQLSVLVPSLAQSNRPADRESARAVAEVLVLPEQAGISFFLDAACGVLERIAGSKWAGDLRQRAAHLAPLGGERVSRPAFVRWAGEVLRMSSRVRDEAGNHPFARVQLMLYAHAEWQPWSHLVLTGLQEGGWPPSHEVSGFLAERRVEALNGSALGPGDQGSGHVAAAAGHGVLLDSAARRALIQRQLFNLVGRVEQRLAVTFSLADETDPGRRRIPGDFLTQLFHRAKGEPLFEGSTEALHRATLDWVQRTAFPKAPVEVAPGPWNAARAYAARRDETRPFGEYEFALTRPPPVPLRLGCKEWERALRAPAQTWLRGVLGVEARDRRTDDPWALIFGNWVHRWLARALQAAEPGAFAKRTKGEVLTRRVAEETEATRTAVESLFEAAGREVPDWWRVGWNEALWLAGRLAMRLSEIEGWPLAATERRLPDSVEVPVPGGRALRLKGRMDLVLAESEEAASGAGPFWVLDYKTGSDKELKEKSFKKDLREGKGVQLSLYALALHVAGARDVALTLLTPETEAGQQITLELVQNAASFWAELARMQDEGVFGQLGEMRPEFGYSAELPLATLEIDAQLLEKKWALTHPDLAEPDEGEAG